MSYLCGAQRAMETRGTWPPARHDQLPGMATTGPSCPFTACSPSQHWPLSDSHTPLPSTALQSAGHADTGHTAGVKWSQPGVSVPCGPWFVGPPGHKVSRQHRARSHAWLLPSLIHWWGMVGQSGTHIKLYNGVHCSKHCSDWVLLNQS